VSFVSYPKRHKPLPTVLSVEEVGALIAAVRNARYQAIVMVLYGAGLRIAEALTLQVTDIDAGRGVIHVRHGKGDKAREAKLSPSLYQWLRNYVSVCVAQDRQGTAGRDDTRCPRACGQAGLDQEARDSTRAAPQLRHPSARAGNRCSRGGGPARARVAPVDGPLRQGDREARAADAEPARPAAATALVGRCPVPRGPGASTSRTSCVAIAPSSSRSSGSRDHRSVL